MTRPLYLSRARLRRDASVATLLPLLQGGTSRNGHSQHSGHHLVWSLFASGPERRRDFLWREMEQNGAFLILSARPPVDRHALFDVDEPKPFTPALVVGDRLRFSLRANPVVRRRDSSRSRSVKHDIINYHPQSGWFDEGPSKGPPPCGRGLKPPEVLLLLVFFLFLLVADVVPNNGLV